MKLHRLRAIRGSLAGQVFELDRRTLIGRSGDAHIQVIERDVSRQHALIFRRDDGKMLLVDLSSTNGTRLGLQRVTRAELHPNAEIIVGQSTFVYEEASDSQPMAAMTDEVDDELKVLSGPALDTTALSSEDEGGRPAAITEPANPVLVNPTSVVDCGDAVHPVAVESGWAYCPACGARLR